MEWKRDTVGLLSGIRYCATVTSANPRCVIRFPAANLSSLPVIATGANRDALAGWRWAGSSRRQRSAKRRLPTGVGTRRHPPVANGLTVKRPPHMMSRPRASKEKFAPAPQAQASAPTHSAC